MNDEVKHPVVKLLSVAAAWTGGLTWGELASMAAFLYTSCLIFEWVWKRVLKPALIHFRVVHGTPRDFMASTDTTPLDESQKR